MFVRTLASALETLALTGAAARAPPTLVFWKVAGVDLDGGTVRSDMIVEVANGWVTHVEPAAGRRAPTSAPATVVDGRGKFIIPGRSPPPSDRHAHLSGDLIA